MRRRLGLSILSAVLLTTGLLTSVGPVGASEPTPNTTPRTTLGNTPPATGAPVTVTLLTGDQVQLTDVGQGRRTLAYTPAKGREQIDMFQHEVDGELLVLPLDVLPYLAAGQLDRSLFTIDTLIEQGYTDAESPTLPLIATYPAGARTASADQLTAAEAGEVLESINGVGLDVSKADAADFWESVSRDIGRSTASTDVRLGHGVGKLWLDARVGVDLDRSVAQIGAPQAWAAGFDGTGTKVAVLDTGVDAEHPDLAGQVSAEADFTASPSPDDRFGHGTHVAATIAGTGAASGGARSGVAPGATILSGKVLGDDGFGSLEGVIAGMEWAVEQGADVVNLSLGAGPTDGQDPVSLALNELSAASDTLFVASAGNDGPTRSTVGAPGAADAALTVGAVDRDESIADFSSRGPRLGDLGLKPDLTAPGVGIVAARASGTSMGDVVDEFYTRASGTSMAAPHVAGAAAILAQQHPAWGGEQLKDGLVSTAAPADLTIEEQGGGRVDVARASGQGVYGTGSRYLGEFHDGDAEVKQHQISYTNTTAADVELALEVDVRDPGGDPIAEGALDLDQETVTVPSHGTVSVTLSVDPAAFASGRYTGTLVATAGEIVVHTTLGVHKLAPTHTVTFSGVDLGGEPGFWTPVVVIGEDPRYDSIFYLPEGVERELVLGEGKYFLHAMFDEYDFAGEEASFVTVDPDLEVTGDAVVVLDPRKSSRITFETPQPAEQRGMLGFVDHRAVGGRTISNHTNKFDGTTSVWVTPTEPADEGTFEFTSRWQLVAPMLTATVKGGEELEVWPHYLNTSEPLEGRRTLPVVVAGRGTPADYANVDVAGKIALVSPDEQDTEALAAAGADAGAAFVLAMPPNGRLWFTDWQPDGERLPVPAAVLSPPEARALADRIAEGPLTLTLDGQVDSPYLYDVMQVASGQVPEQIVHDVAETSAVVTTDYRYNGGTGWAKEQRYAWRPWQDVTVIENQRDVRTPARRREYMTGGDTLWRHHVLPHHSWDDYNPVTSGMHQDLQTYAVGEKVDETWFGAVVRPAIPQGVDWMTSYREGDTLTLRIPEFVDAHAGHFARPEPYQLGEANPDLVAATLYENGEKIAETDHAWGTFAVSASAGDYRLDLSTARIRDEWLHGIRTKTSWTFASARSEEPALLPLLQVDYGVPADQRNRVRAGRPASLTFSARMPDGVETPAIASFDAWHSYDDGESWHKLTVRERDGSYIAKAKLPKLADTNGFVSVRVEARTVGTGISQTVERAYSLK